MSVLEQGRSNVSYDMIWNEMMCVYKQQDRSNKTDNYRGQTYKKQAVARIADCTYCLTADYRN